MNQFIKMEEKICSVSIGFKIEHAFNNQFMMKFSKSKHLDMISHVHISS
jgi:hypothetical protein